MVRLPRYEARPDSFYFLFLNVYIVLRVSRVIVNYTNVVSKPKLYVMKRT